MPQPTPAPPGGPRSQRPLLLSVNVDHVATLRQARGTTYPEPTAAAALAEQAGAHGITVHLRGDRRHIQDHDVRRLADSIAGKLNLEMAPTEEMLRIATELRPQQVTLVPERPEEVTTEGGLDVVAGRDPVRAAAERLASAGIEVSVFLDPDPDQVSALSGLGTELVPGFEINTDAYTQASAQTLDAELEKITAAAALGSQAGFRVFAGHGLTSSNVVPIAAVPEVEELNIGHWIVSRASLVGMQQAVVEMLDAMRAGRSG
ncbi:MAG: pyridoxine 5'-phosphate synthase [Acidobacteriota bacterium]